jgi:nucleoside-diphosphate-sugar epimerase
MKALVIGASGMVGGALMRALEQSGAEAVGSYRSRPMNGGSLKLDVTDGDAVESCLRDVKPGIATDQPTPAADGRQGLPGFIKKLGA